MLANIKECVNNHDIKRLRYIFVDCLDVDPTFEKYKEDYEICKRVEGLFEPYTELTPLTQDKTCWDKQYWEQLKIDLLKNFSSKRFEHMVKVAKVVYADKISRLLEERKREQQSQKSEIKNNTPYIIKTSEKTMPAKNIQNVMDSEAKSKKSVSNAEIQARQLEEKKRKLEAENRKVEFEQRKQREKIEAAQGQEDVKLKNQKGHNASKKWMGIALLVVLVMAVILIIYSVNTMQ